MFVQVATVQQWTRTFNTATAGLEHPGVHVHPGLRHQLVSHQVGVVRRGNKVAAQWPIHVLVHTVVVRVENVPSWAAHVVGKACSGEHQVSN